MMTSPYQATHLFEELTNKYCHEVVLVVNVRVLAIYTRSSVDALSRTTKDVAINATFRNNNTGMELHALLAELDGTGVPMAYLLVEMDPSNENSPKGTTTQVLDRFLRPLQQAGLALSFIDCDKVRSEINAAQQVWPLARVQLCFWYAKRSIKMKLKDSFKVNSLAYYVPGKAHVLVRRHQICWGSIPGPPKRSTATMFSKNMISLQFNRSSQ